MEKVNQIVTDAVQGITHAFTYGAEEAQHTSTGAGLIGDNRSAGDVVQQRGGEMMDTAMVGASELKDRASDSASEYYEQGKDKAGELYEQGKDKAGDYAEQAKDKAADYAEQAKEKAGELYEQGKEKSSEFFTQTKDKINEDTRAIVQDIRYAANDKSEEIMAKTEETKASLKEYIGEKMESLKETILQGDQSAHDMATGHGLMTTDENVSDKAAGFKESAKETLDDLSGRVFGTSADKFEKLAEKTDDAKDSLKENVDSAADKLKEFCEDAEAKLNDAASPMDI